jgi:hypothetical protein
MDGHVFSFTRKFDYSIGKVTFQLSYENWDDFFFNVAKIFNNFLNTYLTIFFTSFPINKLQYSSKFIESK